MRFNELQTHNVVINGVTYNPIATCEIKFDENGNQYGEWTITKSAEDAANDIINFIPQKAEPTQEEILRANLLKDNVATKLQLAQQQKINANILTQLAKLTGGQNNG